jgi:hypothetical protein
MATIDPVTGAVSYAPFFDSFDDGLVNFPDNWNVDTSVPGQVTFNRPEPWLNAGMLEATGTPADGHGYGTYTVQAKMEGFDQGPAIMLWPGDNIWPGSEIDFGEITNDGSGQQYASLHWDAGGYDDNRIQLYDPAIKGGVFHEYQVLWEPERLVMSVDGVPQAEYTGFFVPADYAHGGMDHVFAFLNINPATSLTVTEISYVPLYGEPGAGMPPAAEEPPPIVVDPPPVVEEPPPAAGEPVDTASGDWDWSNGSDEPLDWDAIAAQVLANYEATGTWWY